MIIGKNKQQVIQNIEKAAKNEDFYAKVEIDDPELSVKMENRLLKKYLRTRKKIGYIIRNIVARAIVDTASRGINRTTEYEGLENIKNIKSGAIVTSNHFNPVDNTAVRMAVKKTRRGRLYIVSQISNLAMGSWVGFLMRFTDIIPICARNKKYMNHQFAPIIQKLVRKKQWVLIYPEQEMWFNYRKPRPPKRGAYYYAAKFNVPIVSFFVEIRDMDEKENEEFYKVKYIVHALPAIYPSPDLSVKENSVRMMQTDYEQKKAAYEKAYGKAVDYTFDLSDIAGWIGEK